MNAVSRVLVIVALVVVGYYGLLFLVQRHMLFPAPRGLSTTIVPTDARHVRLLAAGDSIDAWYLPALTEGPRHPTVIFTHGNAERAEDWTVQMRDLRRAGLAVLVPEYPGYGASKGSPSQEALTAAALAAYDWLRGEPGVDSTRIVGYGRSIGGGVATRLATRRHLAALVLESSFTSLRAFARQFGAPGFLVRDPFDNLAELSRYRGPLLVLHGDHDEVAPFAHGRALAAAVPGATFAPMPCGHNDCDRPWRIVVQFLAQHHVLESLPNSGFAHKLPCAFVNCPSTPTG